MSRFTKILPALTLAAGLLPIAASAGPVAGRLIAPVQQPALSQGHFSGTDPLAGQRQAATGTQPRTPQNEAGSQVNGGLSLGHLSATDPLAGQRQAAGNTTAG